MGGRGRTSFAPSICAPETSPPRPFHRIPPGSVCVGAAAPERIRRHNEIARKIAAHCRSKGWTVEEEPHIRHPLGHLYKPDIVIHREGLPSVVCDVQVSWDGYEPLGEISKGRMTTIYSGPQPAEDGRGRPSYTFRQCSAPGGFGLAATQRPPLLWLFQTNLKPAASIPA
ncbi:hypothetical protein QE152_g22793 [Popillia japonica]|uniref:Uncharacterized protein n=1 Tax=Popillia japonica TaxID=7064 RepID=A0AAW1KJI6_POPJA